MLAKVQAALAALPRVPDRIATWLLGRGCLGRPGPGSCPLAVYFRRELGLKVYVCPIYPSPRWGVVVERYDHARDVLAPLPDGPTEFARRFDNRQYPDLVAPEGRP